MGTSFHKAFFKDKNALLMFVIGPYNILCYSKNTQTYGRQWHIHALLHNKRVKFETSSDLSIIANIEFCLSNYSIFIK